MAKTFFIAALAAVAITALVPEAQARHCRRVRCCYQAQWSGYQQTAFYNQPMVNQCSAQPDGVAIQNGQYQSGYQNQYRDGNPNGFAPAPAPPRETGPGQQNFDRNQQNFDRNQQNFDRNQPQPPPAPQGTQQPQQPQQRTQPQPQPDNAPLLRT